MYISGPSQHGWQGCLLWMRSGVDRHRPRAAARAANQYVLGVRGHPAGAAISARGIRETTTIRRYQKPYQADVACSKPVPARGQAAVLPVGLQGASFDLRCDRRKGEVWIVCASWRSSGKWAGAQPAFSSPIETGNDAVMVKTIRLGNDGVCPQVDTAGTRGRNRPVPATGTNCICTNEERRSQAISS